MTSRTVNYLVDAVKRCSEIAEVPEGNSLLFTGSR